MLTERKAAILRAIVEGYISTSEPVGSSQIVQSSGLDVSSATIRSEMSALEDGGYLSQPHTSAGRVPSEKGYRYFVDSLMEPHTVDAIQQRKVSSFFGAAQGELERMLSDTSSFLAQLTDYAAVVVGPDAEASQIRGLQVVRLSDDQVMVVLVHANAVITKRVLVVDPATSAETLRSAATRLERVYLGGTGRRDGTDRPGQDHSEASILFTDLDAAIRASVEEAPVYVGGTSTVAGIFDAVDQVQEVLRVLEKQYLVVTLVKDVIDRGLKVAIGSETGVEPLAECSLVVAPIEVDGQRTGSISLLGPTRMNYPQAMATVALVSQQLGRHLGGEAIR